MTGFPIAGPSLMLCTPASPLMVSPSDGACAVRSLSWSRMLVGCGEVSAVVTLGLAVTWTSGSSTADGRIDTVSVTASAPTVTRRTTGA